MIGNYAYTPYLWPSAVTALFLVVLAVYSWRRRSVPGVRPFLISCLFAAVWAASSVMELAATDMETKIFWSKIQSCVQAPVVIAVTWFILEYAWPGRWVTSWSLILQGMIPVAAIGLALTNDFHNQAWIGFGLNGSGAVQQQLGPIFWLFIITILPVYQVITLFVFAWLFKHSPQHRWPVVLIVVGQFMGRTLYVLVKARVLQFALPLELFGMGFEFLVYAIALFGFHILDPIPLARQTAIEQLHAGMVVLDPQENIASLNPAAERILGTTAKAARGSSIRRLLPEPTVELLDDCEETEVSLGKGPAVRYSMLAVSKLNDWRGLEVGRLLILRDITEQKLAREQILEQQRALAALHERERLARELHDSTSQVLGYASLQVGATRKLVADGKLQKTDELLAALESVLSDAHADLRESILNLHTVPAVDKPFFLTLQKYLDGYRQNYGIQVEVVAGKEMSEDLFSAEAQLQLLHIIQEALSNARKHAQAKCVQVSFQRENGHISIRIQDNGQGFALHQAASTESGHFGLHFMRERAEAMGGSLRVQSRPGMGTCIEVEVPVEAK